MVFTGLGSGHSLNAKSFHRLVPPTFPNLYYTLLARLFYHPAFAAPSHIRLCSFLKRLLANSYCILVNLINKVTNDFYCTETPRHHFPHATWGKEAIKAKK